MGRALLLCLLLTALGTAHAAPPRQWLPWESWPGGKQYDARLDRPVTLWMTGTPLAKVFAAIQQQTGVEIGFFPREDDDNARVCVNLYLNSKQPPTLRDLLAQLAWVLDCSFVFTGEGEAKTYALLSTSTGAQAMEQLQPESSQRAREAEVERERLRRERVAVARARLEEIGGALDLSREEAIRKYRGKDDQVLLALVDPARRALAQYLLSLPPHPDRLEQLGRWQNWSPEQQDWLWAAMQPMLEDVTTGRNELPDMGIDWRDRKAVEGLGLTVHVTFWETGAVTVGSVFTSRWDEKGNPREGRGIGTPELWLATDPSVNPSVEIALRQALGQPMAPEEEQRFAQEVKSRAKRQADRRWLEGQCAQLVHLSTEAATRLGETALSVKLDEPHALWQIQELVAAQTGMHVVSDAFWQPARSVQTAVEAMPPARAGEPTALEALRLSCVALTPGGSAPPRERLGSSGWRGTREEIARWEWGDAGSFLRFRSPERDVWRAALLPPQTANTVTAWLAPHLPGDLEQATVTVPIDPWRLAQLLAGLTEPQRRWGGMLTYGDPADPHEQYLYAMRDRLFEVADRARHAFQLLGVMSEVQWKRLNEAELRWGDDVALPRSNPGADREYWSHFRKGDPIYFATNAPPGRAGAILPPESSTTWRWLVLVRRGGTGTDYQQLPLDVVLRPTQPKHLVPPPP